MNVHKWVLVVGLGLGIATTPIPTDAKTLNIEGTNVADPESFNGNYTCESNNSKHYTISGSGRVDVDDVNPDSVMLHGVTITASDAETCGHIYFWEQFTPPPSGNIKFDLLSNGLLKRPTPIPAKAAKDSWIQMSAWAQYASINPAWNHQGSSNGPPGDVPTQQKIVSVLLPLSAGSFNLTTSPNQTETINVGTSAYSLKGEIWFNLKNAGDQLILNEGSGIKVITAQGGGETGPDSRTGECPKECTRWIEPIVIVIVIIIVVIGVIWRRMWAITKRP